MSPYAADWTFLGADASHATAAIINTNALEILLKRAMIPTAGSVVVVDS